MLLDQFFYILKMDLKNFFLYKSLINLIFIFIKFHF